jgi:hypothetical protein
MSYLFLFNWIKLVTQPLLVQNLIYINFCFLVSDFAGLLCLCFWLAYASRYDIWTFYRLWIVLGRIPILSPTIEWPWWWWLWLWWWLPTEVICSLTWGTNINCILVTFTHTKLWLLEVRVREGTWRNLCHYVRMIHCIVPCQHDGF